MLASRPRAFQSLAVYRVVIDEDDDRIHVPEVVERNVPEVEVVEGEPLEFSDFLIEGFEEEKSDPETWQKRDTVVPKRANQGDVWKLGRHILVVGDCRDQKIAEQCWGTASLCFSSPPYADRREYDSESGFTPITADRYVDWFESVQKTVGAILKQNGSFCLNIRAHAENGFRHLYVYDLVLSMCRKWGWGLVDDMVWRRPGYPGKWPNRLKNDWEGVYHFCRESGLAAFNPSSAGVKSDRCIQKVGKKVGRHTGNNFSGHDTRGDGVALPSNVVYAQCSNESMHQAAFPEALADFYVKVFSNEGDWVLDPFCGSGTTLVACEKNGRNGIGIELSPKYADIAIDRMTLLGIEPELMSSMEVGQA